MGKLANALTLDPEDVRGSLLTLVLWVIAILGSIVYVPSVIFAGLYRLYGVVAVDTLALATIIGLLASPRIPYRWRAAGFCFVCYMLGVGLLIGVGSICQIYLFGFSLMGVLLLGLRFGLFAILLSSVTLFAIGALGYASPEMGVASNQYGLAAWALITLNFALIDLAISMALGAVLSVLSRALAKEIASRAERARLLAQLQLQIERMPLAYLLSDPDFRFTRWNPAAEQLFGYAEAEVLGERLVDVIVPLAFRGHATTSLERIKTGTVDAYSEGDCVTKDGRTIRCEWTTIPLFTATGQFDGTLMLGTDVTERRKLEIQLRQSQKMEAVGQLAGGVAHDFNNLLSVILSYAEMVLADLPAKDPIRRELEEIHSAGSRAAGLTRKLLMFSRQQVVQPKVLDLNEILAGFAKMVRPIVGEGIELAILPAPSLGRIRADAGSIEQVIMNLVVNARDAMPMGGKLTIETANVTLDEAYARSHVDAKVGPYVMLAVTDMGTGMDKPTLARIFEPFFTTKDKSKGTGLGLSTVFGIVQQSGGTVWVYSEPDLGTTFKVYLPRVDAEFEPTQAATETTRRGFETILLVEDEDQVREVAQGILRRHGYRVLAARNPGEALLSCEQHVGPIQLLLTDVVMAQLSGPALAKRLATARPEMKVLFMSGYTDDAAVRHGVIVAEVAYLQKPLTVESLTRKVRGVLDASASPSDS